MSSSIRLRIPEEHLEAFNAFFNLSSKDKGLLYDSLSKYSGELMLRTLSEYLMEFIKIDNKKLKALAKVYLSLVNSNASFDGSIEDFINHVAVTLKEDYDRELNESELNDLNELLSSSGLISRRSKILDLMIENPRTFNDVRIFQDLKTAFDENGNILASAIVHNLKITVTEGEDIKDYFIFMDNSDLESLSLEIEKAKQNKNRIQQAFNNANIIDI